jgi:hypothetical protein
MYQPDNKTILNDVISSLDSKLGPIATQSQLTQNILNGIQTGRKNFKPYTPKKMCNYPNPPRIDEFNMNEGLGIMSLQPVIDGLNHFKAAAINEIKTKFQAMGPENAKDTKLAAGAIELIKNVYDAAKCFSQIITNITTLVNSYVQTINFLIVNVIERISQLEREIIQLKGILNKRNLTNTLIQLASQALVDKLTQATDIFDLLGAVVELQNALAQAEMSARSLRDTPKRVRKQLMITLTLLQNRINSFLYYQAFHGTLKTSRTTALASIPADDFLDNFDFTEVKESSFNWSLTNSGSIFDCNSDDELVILPKMNQMARHFSTTGDTAITVASRNEEGWIVVPDTGEGLISAGLDPRLGSDINLTFDLSINNGETIVKSIARGAPLGPDDKVMKRSIGSYYNYGKETFDYNKMIDNGDDTFSLYVTDLTKMSDFQIGDCYYFNNPITQIPWKFSWNGGIKTNFFPVLFKIIDISVRYVKVIILNPPEIKVSDFIPLAQDFDYTYNNPYTAPPGNANGKLRLDAETGLVLTNQIISTDPGDYMIYLDGVEKKKYIELDVITLLKYNLVSLVNKVPHAGEKIRCHNWSLNVRISGNVGKVNKMQFSGQFPGEAISMFFLKAKWGFIPIQS